MSLKIRGRLRHGFELGDGVVDGIPAKGGKGSLQACHSAPYLVPLRRGTAYEVAGVGGRSQRRPREPIHGLTKLPGQGQRPFGLAVHCLVIGKGGHFSEAPRAVPGPVQERIFVRRLIPGAGSSKY